MTAWLLERLAALRFDAWEALGLLGEGLFFARLAAQWIASERERRPVLPMAYWYMSLAGAALVAAYALHKASLVVLLPQFAGGPFYARGLVLERRHRARERARAAAGFDRPGFPWPRLAVIVPVHNEAGALPATLAGLVARAAEYPGPPPAIVVAGNGCTDNSPALARAYLADPRTGWEPSVVVHDARAGMSFGKNLGARAARSTGADLWLFVDADTALPGHALRRTAEALHGVARPAATVRGAPDRGGGVVRAGFAVANRFARRHRAHAPGGVMAMSPEVFDAAGGFDESLPQGTSTDFLKRAAAAGAAYVYIDAFAAVTSVRRFRKTGIVRQLLAWRRNHRDLDRGRRAAVGGRAYENVRE